MRPHPTTRILVLCLTLGFLHLALPGCDDDDDDNPVNPGATTQLTGTFANPSEGGKIEITIQAASLAPSRRAASVGSHTVLATAVITPEIGPPAQVTGTYSEETDSLYLNGSGYSVRGLFDDASAAMWGQFGGPSGGGFLTGSFVCAVGGSNAVQVYCGAFQDEDDVSRGRWNMVLSGTQVWAIGALYSGFFYEVEGTVSGAGPTRTIMIEEQTTAFGHDVSAEGTLDTGTGLAQGAWASSVEGTPINIGVWSTMACAPGGPTTELTGTILYNFDNGPVYITIGSGALSPARPVASLGVHQIPAIARQPLNGENLSGYYNPETDSLDLGGKPIYTMVGKYDESGGVPGIFGRVFGGRPFISAVGGPETVKPLCGSFENQGQTMSGPWDLLVVGAAVRGMAVSTGGAEFSFSGMLTGTGTTRTITLAGSDGEGGTLTATGTLDTTTFTVTNGTWSFEIDSAPVDSGSWGGDACDGSPIARR